MSSIDKKTALLLFCAYRLQWAAQQKNSYLEVRRFPWRLTISSNTSGNVVNLLSERDIHVSLNWLTHRCHSNVVTCFNRKFRRCYCDNSNFDSSVGRGMGGGGVLVRKKFESPFTTSSANKYICYSQCCCSNLIYVRGSGCFWFKTLSK